MTRVLRTIEGGIVLPVVPKADYDALLGTQQTLAQALRYLRDTTSSEHVQNVCRRTLEEAGIPDPPDSDLADLQPEEGRNAESPWQRAWDTVRAAMSDAAAGDLHAVDRKLRVLEVELRPEGDACEHDWVSARNEAVQSGEMCSRCHALRPEENDG